MNNLNLLSTSLQNQPSSVLPAPSPSAAPVPPETSLDFAAISASFLALCQGGHPSPTSKATPLAPVPSFDLSSYSPARRFSVLQHLLSECLRASPATQAMRDSFRETLITYLRSLNSVSMDEALIRQIVGASLNTLFVSSGSLAQKLASFTEEHVLNQLAQGEAALATLHRLQTNPSDLSSLSLRDAEQLVLSFASLGLEEEGMAALMFLEQKMLATPLAELSASARAQMWERVSENLSAATCSRLRGLALNRLDASMHALFPRGYTSNFPVANLDLQMRYLVSRAASAGERAERLFTLRNYYRALASRDAGLQNPEILARIESGLREAYLNRSSLVSESSDSQQSLESRRLSAQMLVDLENLAHLSPDQGGLVLPEEKVVFHDGSEPLTLSEAEVALGFSGNIELETVARESAQFLQVQQEERRAHQTQLREVLREYLEREDLPPVQLNLRYQALVAYRASMAASASQDHPNSANQRVDLSFASSFLRNLALRQVERGLENISNQIEAGNRAEDVPEFSNYTSRQQSLIRAQLQGIAQVEQSLVSSHSEELSNALSSRLENSLSLGLVDEQSAAYESEEVSESVSQALEGFLHLHRANECLQQASDSHAHLSSERRHLLMGHSFELKMAALRSLSSSGLAVGETLSLARNLAASIRAENEANPSDLEQIEVRNRNVFVIHEILNTLSSANQSAALLETKEEVLSVILGSITPPDLPLQLRGGIASQRQIAQALQHIDHGRYALAEEVLNNAELSSDPYAALLSQNLRLRRVLPSAQVGMNYLALHLNQAYATFSQEGNSEAFANVSRHSQGLVARFQAEALRLISEGQAHNLDEALHQVLNQAPYANDAILRELFSGTSPQARVFQAYVHQLSGSSNPEESHRLSINYASSVQDGGYLGDLLESIQHRFSPSGDETIARRQAGAWGRIRDRMHSLMSRNERSFNRLISVASFICPPLGIAYSSFRQGRPYSGESLSDQVSALRHYSWDDAEGLDAASLAGQREVAIETAFNEVSRQVLLEARQSRVWGAHSRLHYDHGYQLHWAHSIGETIRRAPVVGLIAGRTKADRDYTWISIAAILAPHVFISYAAEGGMGSFMVEVMANPYTKSMVSGGVNGSTQSVGSTLGSFGTLSAQANVRDHLLNQGDEIGWSFVSGALCGLAPTSLNRGAQRFLRQFPSFAHSSSMASALAHSERLFRSSLAHQSFKEVDFWLGEAWIEVALDDARAYFNGSAQAQSSRRARMGLSQEGEAYEEYAHTWSTYLLRILDSAAGEYFNKGAEAGSHGIRVAAAQLAPSLHRMFVGKSEEGRGNRLWSFFASFPVEGVSSEERIADHLLNPVIENLVSGLASVEANNPPSGGQVHSPLQADYRTSAVDQTAAIQEAASSDEAIEVVREALEAALGSEIFISDLSHLNSQAYYNLCSLVMEMGLNLRSAEGLAALKSLMYEYVNRQFTSTDSLREEWLGFVGEAGRVKREELARIFRSYSREQRELYLRHRELIEGKIEEVLAGEELLSEEGRGKREEFERELAIEHVLRVERSVFGGVLAIVRGARVQEAGAVLSRLGDWARLLRGKRELEREEERVPARQFFGGRSEAGRVRREQNNLEDSSTGTPPKPPLNPRGGDASTSLGLGAPSWVKRGTGGVPIRAGSTLSQENDAGEQDGAASQNDDSASNFSGDEGGQEGRGKREEGSDESEELGVPARQFFGGRGEGKTSSRFPLSSSLTQGRHFTTLVNGRPVAAAGDDMFADEPGFGHLANQDPMQAHLKRLDSGTLASANSTTTGGGEVSASSDNVLSDNPYQLYSKQLDDRDRNVTNGGYVDDPQFLKVRSLARASLEDNWNEWQAERQSREADPFSAFFASIRSDENLKAILKSVLENYAHYVLLHFGKQLPAIIPFEEWIFQKVWEAVSTECEVTENQKNQLREVMLAFLSTQGLLRGSGLREHAQDRVRTPDVLKTEIGGPSFYKQFRNKIFTAAASSVRHAHERYRVNRRCLSLFLAYVDALLECGLSLDVGADVMLPFHERAWNLALRHHGGEEFEARVQKAVLQVIAVSAEINPENLIVNRASEVEKISFGALNIASAAAESPSSFWTNLVSSVANFLRQDESKYSLAALTRLLITWKIGAVAETVRSWFEASRMPQEPRAVSHLFYSFVACAQARLQLDSEVKAALPDAVYLLDALRSELGNRFKPNEKGEIEIVVPHLLKDVPIQEWSVSALIEGYLATHPGSLANLAEQAGLDENTLRDYQLKVVSKMERKTIEKLARAWALPGNDSAYAEIYDFLLFLNHRGMFETHFCWERRDDAGEVREEQSPLLHASQHPVVFKESAICKYRPLETKGNQSPEAEVLASCLDGTWDTLLQFLEGRLKEFEACDTTQIGFASRASNVDLLKRVSAQTPIAYRVEGGFVEISVPEFRRFVQALTGCHLNYYGDALDPNTAPMSKGAVKEMQDFYRACALMGEEMLLYHHPVKKFKVGDRSYEFSLVVPTQALIRGVAIDETQEDAVRGRVVVYDMLRSALTITETWPRQDRIALSLEQNGAYLPARILSALIEMRILAASLEMSVGLELSPDFEAYLRAQNFNDAQILLILSLYQELRRLSVNWTLAFESQYDAVLQDALVKPRRSPSANVPAGEASVDTAAGAEVSGPMSVAKNIFARLLQGKKEALAVDSILESVVLTEADRAWVREQLRNEVSSVDEALFWEHFEELVILFNRKKPCFIRVAPVFTSEALTGTNPLNFLRALLRVANAGKDVAANRLLFLVLFFTNLGRAYPALWASQEVTPSEDEVSEVISLTLAQMPSFGLSTSEFEGFASQDARALIFGFSYLLQIAPIIQNLSQAYCQNLELRGQQLNLGEALQALFMAHLQALMRQENRPLKDLVNQFLAAHPAFQAYEFIRESMREGALLELYQHFMGDQLARAESFVAALQANEEYLENSTLQNFLDTVFGVVAENYDEKVIPAEAIRLRHLEAELQIIELMYWMNGRDIPISLQNLRERLQALQAREAEEKRRVEEERRTPPPPPPPPRPRPRPRPSSFPTQSTDQSETVTPSVAEVLHPDTLPPPPYNSASSTDVSEDDDGPVVEIVDAASDTDADVIEERPDSPVEASPAVPPPIPPTLTPPAATKPIGLAACADDLHRLFFAENLPRSLISLKGQVEGQVARYIDGQVANEEDFVKQLGALLAKNRKELDKVKVPAEKDRNGQVAALTLPDEMQWFVDFIPTEATEDESAEGVPFIFSVVRGMAQVATENEELKTKWLKAHADRFARYKKLREAGINAGLVLAKREAADAQNGLMKFFSFAELVIAMDPEFASVYGPNRETYIRSVAEGKLKVYRKGLCKNTLELNFDCTLLTYHFSGYEALNELDLFRRTLTDLSAKRRVAKGIKQIICSPAMDRTLQFRLEEKFVQANKVATAVREEYAKLYLKARKDILATPKCKERRAVEKVVTEVRMKISDMRYPIYQQYPEFRLCCEAFKGSQINLRKLVEDELKRDPDLEDDSPVLVERILMEALVRLSGNKKQGVEIKESDTPQDVLLSAYSKMRPIFLASLSFEQLQVCLPEFADIADPHEVVATKIAPAVDAYYQGRGTQAEVRRFWNAHLKNDDYEALTKKAFEYYLLEYVGLKACTTAARPLHVIVAERGANAFMQATPLGKYALYHFLCEVQQRDDVSDYPELALADIGAYNHDYYLFTYVSSRMKAGEGAGQFKDLCLFAVRQFKIYALYNLLADAKGLSLDHIRAQREKLLNGEISYESFRDELLSRAIAPKPIFAVACLSEVRNGQNYGMLRLGVNEIISRVYTRLIHIDMCELKRKKRALYEEWLNFIRREDKEGILTWYLKNRTVLIGLSQVSEPNVDERKLASPLLMTAKEYSQQLESAAFKPTVGGDVPVPAQHEIDGYLASENGVHARYAYVAGMKSRYYVVHAANDRPKGAFVLLERLFPSRMSEAQVEKLKRIIAFYDALAKRGFDPCVLGKSEGIMLDSLFEES